MQISMYYVQIKACKLTGDGITPVIPETINENTVVFVDYEKFKNFTKELMFLSSKEAKENDALNL